MNKNKMFRNQVFFGPAFALSAMVAASLALLTGCASMPSGASGNMPDKSVIEQAHDEAIVLREGDVLKITFPGSPNLDTTQPIRRDGKLNLPLIGEVEAAGLTPSTLQDNLTKAYAPQISTKEVVVQVQSSTFPVFVSGAVVRPGKILSDHPITALEAVMECGGFNYDIANMRDVQVVREENGVMKHFSVNLKAVLQGRETKPFYLKPKDIVYVPERFSPF